MATLKDTVATIVSSLQNAVDPEHLVRLDQVQAMLDGVSPGEHTHDPEDIPDLTTEINQRIALYVENTNSISWTAGAASVRRKSAGGILEDADGIYIDSALFSPSGHTHAQLHDPVTVVDGVTLDLEITGQQLTGEAKVKPGGGLGAAGGLHAVFGDQAGEVAEGDHTHPQLHDQVTLGVDPSLRLFLVGQMLSGGVRLAPTGGDRLAFGQDSLGLYIPFGDGADQAAKGDHTHADATESASGFLSPADKTRLNKDRFIHTQDVAANTWTVPHDLGRKPQVTVLNDLEERVFAKEVHESENQVRLEFNGNLTGKVICS